MIKTDHLRNMALIMTNETKMRLPAATGRAKEETRFEVVLNRQYNSQRLTSLKLVAPDYVYYIENGRRPGKQPPRSAIVEWLEVKNIQPQDISLESLAFLIARKIGRDGIEPKHIIKELTAQYRDDIKSAARTDYAYSIKQKTQKILTIFNNKVRR